MNKQIFVSIAESLQWVDDIVVFVWAILSILMIGTAWLLYKNSSGISKEVTLVIILIVATWTYPLYTLNYQLVPGLAGNILYLTGGFCDLSGQKRFGEYRVLALSHSRLG